MKELMKNAQWRIRAVLLLILDIVVIDLTSVFSLLIRFEFNYSAIAQEFLDSIYQYSWVNVVCTVGIFYLFHLYTSLWKYASVNELVNIATAVLLSGAVNRIGMGMMELKVPEKL